MATDERAAEIERARKWLILHDRVEGEGNWDNLLESIAADMADYFLWRSQAGKETSAPES